MPSVIFMFMKLKARLARIGNSVKTKNPISQGDI